MIRRWFFELFHPSAKCARVGHDPDRETRRGYRNPELDEIFRCVAIEFEEERQVCHRCKASLSDWEETYSNDIQSLSLPGSMHRTLKKEGRVLLSQ